jgi:hypothetical protein
MIAADVLQNHLILMSHHVNDAMEALENGEDTIVEASLKDIGEIVDELKSFLPKSLFLEAEAKEMGMRSQVEEIARQIFDD